jgi:hypothetical protein
MLTVQLLFLHRVGEFSDSVVGLQTDYAVILSWFAAVPSDEFWDVI